MVGDPVSACLRPGDTMAVEETSYTGVVDLIESLGATAVPLATDREQIPFMNSTLARHRVRCRIANGFK